MSRVLVACEESQAVTLAFRNLGHEAYSCDLQECSGGHPEWHFQEDCFDIITHGDPDGNDWDLLIAHPVCQYLTNAGSRWLYNPDGTTDEARWKNMREGRGFFMRFLGSETNHIPKIAIENPIPHGHAGLPPYAQCLQPWEFGDNYSKATCLWLKGLRPLVPSVLTEPSGVIHACHMEPPGPERAKNRSKFYPGFAAAMAHQWGTDWKPELVLAPPIMERES